MVTVDPFVVATLLLAAAVIASVVPGLPGGLFSVAGVGYYWYVADGLSALVAVTLLAVGAVALALDWLGGAISARVGGASLQTTAIAAVAAIALAFVLGPLGVLVGIAGTVFALEFRRHGDVDRGVRTAALTTVGMLASAAMQVVFTAGVLVAFLLVV